MTPDDLASIIGSGTWSYIVLLLVGALASEPFRWAGVYLSRNLSVDSEIFKWARAVSTALVAALVARIVVFPSGALQEVAFLIRIGAFAVGLATYFLFRRQLAFGVGASVLVLLVAQMLVSA